MTTKNRAKFIVELAGNVTLKAKQFSASMRKFGTDGNRAMRAFSASVRGTNKLLDRFDNKLVGVVTGGGLVLASKKIAENQQAITHLGTQYNLTADQVTQLDAAINKAASNHKLPYKDVRQGIEVFLSRTNDFPSALNNLDNLALAINGIQLSAVDAGDALGKIWTSGQHYKTPLALKNWLDSVATSSQSGTGNISQQALSTASLAKTTRWQSPQAQSQLLALMRMASQEFDNPQQADAALTDFFNTVTSQAGRETLHRRGGITVKDQLPADLLFQIGTAAKGKERNLRDVFGGDTLKLAMAFNDPAKREQVNRMAHSSTQGLIEQKARQNIDTFNAALTALTNTGERWVNLQLGSPIKNLADAINELSPEELDKYANTLGNIGKGLAVIIAARYAWRGGRAIYDMFKAPEAANKGGTLTQHQGVVPVYVTNWRDSGFNSSPTENKFNRGGVIGAALNTVRELQDLMPSDDEIQQRLETHKKTLYPDGRQSKYSWLPAKLDLFFQDRENKLAQLRDKYPVNAEQLERQAAIKEKYTEPYSPKGEIVVRVEAPQGLQIKTKSVKSQDVNLKVNTGYVWGVPR